MENKKILIIGAGWEQVPMVKKAKEMELYVIATNPQEKAAGFEFADKTIVVDPRDLEELVKIVEKHKPDAVVSDNCDYSLFAVAFLGALYNLPATSIEAAQLTTNKHNMRQRCSQFALPQPKYILAKTPEQAQAGAKEIGLPVVIKPVDNRGSFGVKVVFDEKDIKKNFLHALSNTLCRDVLIEQYIDGAVNLTIDGYAFEDGHLNLGIASKKIMITEEQKPITKEVIYPAEISKEFVKNALENNQKVVQALNIKFGATHAEYEITKDGTPYLLEIANRGGGVMTSESIIPTIANVNMPELLLKQSLGIECKKPIGFDIAQNRSCLLHFFVLQERGIVRKIAGIDKIMAREDILHFMLFVRPGDQIKEVQSGADRHGFFIVTGSSRVDVRDKSNKVLDDLDIKLK